MPYLIDARFEELAAWIQQNEVQYTSQGAFFGDPATIYYRVASRFGYTDQVRQAGPGASNEVLTLDLAVRRGFATIAEAEAFLTEKYPNYMWSGGIWGDQGMSEAEQAAVSSASSASSLDEAGLSLQQSPLDVLQAVQSASGSQNTSNALQPSTPVAIDDLPEEYDPDLVHEAVDSAVQRLTARIGGIQNGRINYTAHSIPGQALTPGTVPFAALNQRLVREALQNFPGPDQAITLTIVPALGIDRWITDGTQKGPGRVWRVAGARLPSSWTPGPGPLRYRVVVPGMKFGVMGTEVIRYTEIGPGGELTVGVSYGIVLSGIPAYGRAMTRILSAQFVGDGPASYAMEEEPSDAPAPGAPSTPYTNPFRVFEERPKTDFDDVTRPYVETFGGPDTVLLPSGGEVLRSSGFTFALLRGRTAREVFQELCSRRTAIGQVWAADGSLEAAAIGDVQVRPPVSAQVLTHDGGSIPNGEFTTMNDSDDLSGEDRVVEGVPFLYKDCRRLTPTNDRFSLVIQPSLVRTVEGPTGTFTSPMAWHTLGLKTSTEREWQLDVIVQ